MDNTYLIPYRVWLRPKDSNEIITFDCAAEFDDQAQEKAKERYPQCVIETCQSFGHLIGLGLD